MIDSLIYGYNSTTNKLNYVTDKTNDANTKLGDFRESINNTSQDYSYDGNGNLMGDNNKLISSISYNHLNLPSEIKVSGKGKITYLYDTKGTKLVKTTVDSTLVPIRTTTTLYVDGFEYKNDTLQHIAHEEGRIRPRTPGRSDTMMYDYFEKDHLGNVRITLTDELKTDGYPPASMEDVADPNNSEDPVNYIPYYSRTDYNQDPSWRHAIADIPDYPVDNYTTPNDYVTKLNGLSRKIGSGIGLKVMAGDKFNVRVSSWWKSTETPNSPQSLFDDLLSMLSGSVSGVSESKFTSSQLTGSSSVQSGITTFLNSQENQYTDRPRAYLNWILLDEQMNLVYDGCGFDQVGENEEFKVHLLENVTVAKSGYLYIYISNETPNIDVFFDNLQVTHIRGPLLSEDHYYPFGIMMNGISGKALAFGGPENKRNKFQNQEFNNDLEVSYYEFKWRHHDPQTGRFIQIDPLSEEYVYNSTYAFSENKVTGHVELEGLEASEATSNRSIGNGIVNGLKRFALDVVYLGVAPGVDPSLIRSQATGQYTPADVANNLLTVAYPQFGMNQTIDAFIQGDNQTRAEIITGTTLNAAAYFVGAKAVFNPTAASTAEVSAGANVARTVAAETSAATTASQEVNLAARAKEIHSTLKPATQNRTTTAVGTATTSEGNTVSLVASSEHKLRPAQMAALKPGEIAVTGPGHAEVTIINHATANGMKVNAVAASRPICSGCATAINNAGATPASELKKTLGIQGWTPSSPQTQ